MPRHGLGNPAALAVLSSKEGKKEVAKTTQFVGMGFRYILGAIGIGAVVYIGRGIYLDAKAQAFAEKNIGNPDVIAASVIYGSFSRFAPGGILSMILPSFEIAADEAALNQIANQVTSIHNVARAYRIMFRRSMSEDVINGLSTDELQNFYNRINQPGSNQQETPFLINEYLYVAFRTGLTIPIAKKDSSGNWYASQELYGTFENKDNVGYVTSVGQLEDGKYYYIICWSFWNIGPCTYGIVYHDQVTNIKDL
ncbi:hypothetical protein [Kordia sp.]|uniref:hypothetical protein n=1 Tax=Kordia sp. TaxID=1965332 RepID=UPI0025BBCA3D|nr:hypothetical protein [Kordia sp.]MCH2194393.1 hypothetical protein [Kordia sp.]